MLGRLRGRFEGLVRCRRGRIVVQLVKCGLIFELVLNWEGKCCFGKMRRIYPYIERFGVLHYEYELRQL